MKHAICILAHNNFSVLKSLLTQLDSPEFGIYLHVNSQVQNYSEADIKKEIKNTQIFFLPRLNTRYCEYSMQEAINSMLVKAAEKHYDYYHVVSGADLMNCTRRKFLSFFEENRGTEFVGISSTFIEERVKYRHFFTSYSRHRSPLVSRCFQKLRLALIALQKFFSISVNFPKNFKIKKGTDWYSITHAAVEYLIKNEPFFKHHFYHAYCPTEFFAQSLLWNSKFRSKLSSATSENEQCARTIDWERGLPYTFTIDDYQYLKNSSGVFARKFDENTDMEIVHLLLNDTINAR